MGVPPTTDGCSTRPNQIPRRTLRAYNIDSNTPIQKKETNMNDWNVETLKQYVDRRFDDADKAVQAALVSQEKAINKAETAAERRFDLLNELREGVATKDQLDSLEKVVDGLKDRINI